MTAAGPKRLQERIFWLELGMRIAVARTAKGWTQSRLAQRVKLSRVSIANLEAGRQRSDLYRIAAVADALGVVLGRIIPQVRDDGTSRSPRGSP